MKAGSPQPFIQPYYSGQIDWFIMQQTEEREEKTKYKTLQANP